MEKRWASSIHRLFHVHRAFDFTITLSSCPESRPRTDDFIVVAQTKTLRRGYKKSRYTERFVVSDRMHVGQVPRLALSRQRWPPQRMMLSTGRPMI